MDELKKLYNLYNNTNYGCWACDRIANPYTGFGRNAEKCLNKCAIYKMYAQLMEYEKKYANDKK